MTYNSRSLKSPLKHLSSANLNGQKLRHQKEDKTTSRNQTRGRSHAFTTHRNTLLTIKAVRGRHQSEKGRLDKIFNTSGV